jgi:hypothetical protein
MAKPGWNGIFISAVRKDKQMMNYLSLSRRAERFESLRWIQSKAIPRVRYAVRQPSLAQRIELTKRLHDLTLRHEFLAKGNELDQLEMALADLLVQKLFVEWGLGQLDGLDIDGAPATIESLIERGPEELVAEIAAEVRHECGLTDEERKNF